MTFTRINWSKRFISRMGAVFVLAGILALPATVEGGEKRAGKKTAALKKVPTSQGEKPPEAGPKLTAEESEFFEQKIRPVLVKECYRCHSQEAVEKKKLKGDLLLDSREALLKGGDTGPAIVPGKPEESLLMKALRHQEGFEMPPDGKLADAILQDFAKWITMGAPDPRITTSMNPSTPKREIKLEVEREFWSFKPLAHATPPRVKNHSWVKNPIDQFILAQQKAKRLVPNAPASREKLMRRAYFDITGLPPTPEEARVFLEDNSADAYERLVDKLLASPRYGERWARHWLDVVRFAESGGYEFDGDRPGAYNYRDWVVKSLNEDLPYDRFIQMQIAGDKLLPGDFHAGAATGFLVAGPYPGQITAKTVERIRYDQLDDMLATVGSSMLGMTIACARCHDHKYDPIPQQDYTRLLAVFGKTTFGEAKLDPEPSIYRVAKARWDAAHVPFVAAVEKDLESEFPTRFAAWRQTAKPADATWQTLDWVIASATRPGLEPMADGTFKFMKAAAVNDIYTLVARTYQTNLTAFRLDAIPDPSLPGKGPGLDKDGNFELSEISITLTALDGTLKQPALKLKLKPIVASMESADRPLKNAVDNNGGTSWGIKGGTATNQSALFAIEGGPVGFKGGSTITIQLTFQNTFPLGQGRVSMGMGPEPASLAGESTLQNEKEIHTLTGQDAELTPGNRAEVARFLRRFDPATEKVLGARDAHAKLEPKPALLPVYSASLGGGDVFFLSRGEVDRKQGKADPGFMQVLMRSPEKEIRWMGTNAPSAVDPRVALAQWMTDTQHGAGHLVARVMVNRLWRNHFGRGIVETPNDFGTQGEKPTHPELLDWLASELIRNNWQLKSIHRLILNSSTYRQDGKVSASNQKRDPDNKLWWHRPPRRLEAEPIRDALLAVANRLDYKLYGPGTLDATIPRRSIYLTVKRSNLVPFLQVFDAPEAIQSQGNRSTTTLPTQALALMNSPWVRDLAGRVSKRSMQEAGNHPATAVGKAFQMILSRGVSPLEKERLVSLFESHKQLLGEIPDAAEQAMDEVCLTLFCLNEFVYID